MNNLFGITNDYVIIIKQTKEQLSSKILLVNMTEYNIYCDERYHLEHDRQPIIVIGYTQFGFTPDGIAIMEGKG